MPDEPKLRVRRIYDEAATEDGARILVDRIWPRGLRRDSVRIDAWYRQVAPSMELRTWYAHDPDRFEEFGRRYRIELEDPERAAALADLRGLARDQSVTLLTASKDVEISQAAVLADLIRSDLTA